MRNTFIALTSLVVVLLFGQLLVTLLRGKMDDSIVAELPGLAFAAFPAIQARISSVVRGLNASLSQTAGGPSKFDPLIATSWSVGSLLIVWAVIVFNGLTSLWFYSPNSFVHYALDFAGVRAAHTPPTLNLYYVLLAAGWAFAGFALSGRAALTNSSWGRTTQSMTLALLVGYIGGIVAVAYYYVMRDILNITILSHNVDPYHLGLRSFMIPAANAMYVLFWRDQPTASIYIVGGFLLGAALNSSFFRQRAQR